MIKKNAEKIFKVFEFHFQKNYSTLKINNIYNTKFHKILLFIIIEN
jgi:hypothetical protein